MSQENVETVRRAIDAWNADDLDAVLAELDADLEWHPSIEPGLEGTATVYRGHDGARKAWREYRGEAWERLISRPQELRDLGESVLLLGQIEFTARTTGIKFSQEVGEVFEFRGGKIVHARDFLTHAEALEAAGLRESAVSQENLEILRRMVDSWNRGDLDECFAYFAPEGEWRTTGRFADEGVYRGREAIERLFAEIRDDLEEQSFSVSDARVVSEDVVLVGGVWAARGKRSTAGTEESLWYVVTLRDGLVVRVEAHLDAAQALEAAGLRE